MTSRRVATVALKRYYHYMIAGLQMCARRSAHFCGRFFGKRYSSDVTGDGPKTIKSPKPSERIKSKRGKKDKLRKSNPSTSFVNSSKSRKKAKKIRPKPEKIAPDAIPEHRLDLAPGIVDNIAADSQAGIHGRKCHNGNVHDIFQSGLTKAREPLLISGVVGGEVRLSHYGTATYHFTKADDSSQTEKYQVPGTWAVPGHVTSWDTSIISVARLLATNWRNKLVTISSDPNAPYGVAAGPHTSFGIELHSGNGDKFITRIHELDDRWWLSGRSKRKASRSKSNQIRQSLKPHTGDEKVTTLLGWAADRNGTHLTAVSFKGSVNSLLTTLDKSRRKSKKSDSSSKTTVPKKSRRNQVVPSTSTDKRRKRRVHVVTTRSKKKVSVPSKARAKSSRMESDKPNPGRRSTRDGDISVTLPTSKLRAKKVTSSVPDESCVPIGTPVSLKSKRKKSTKPLRRLKHVETKEQNGDAKIAIEKESRSRQVEIDGLGNTTFHAAPLWQAPNDYTSSRRLVMIMHGHCSRATQRSTFANAMYQRFPTAAPESHSRGSGDFQPGEFHMTSLQHVQKRRYLVTLLSQRQNTLPESKRAIKAEWHDRLSLFNSSLQMLAEKLIYLGNKNFDKPTKYCLKGTVIAFNLKTLGSDGRGEFARQFQNRSIDFAQELQCKGARIVIYGTTSKELATSANRPKKKRERDADDRGESKRRRKGISPAQTSTKPAGSSKSASSHKVKRKASRGTRREHSMDTPADYRLTARAGRQPRSAQISKRDLHFSTALKICGGMSRNKILQSSEHWANTVLSCVPKSNNLEASDQEFRGLMNRRLGRRSNQSIRRPLQYGHTCSVDFIFFAHPSLGGHKVALVMVEHWSSTSFTQSCLRKDATTAYQLIEDGFDYFDNCGAGPAQRLIVTMSSDDDKALNNSMIRALCATRCIELQTEAARNPAKNSKHETVIQDLKNGANSVNDRAGGSDWSYASALLFFENVRNRFLVVGDRPAPPLAMLTNLRFDMEYVYPFLTEIYGMDINLKPGKSDPLRIKLYIINFFHAGVIAIDEYGMKEHRLSRRQFTVPDNQFDASISSPFDAPKAFEAFRLATLKAPPTNQHATSPFSAARQGLVRPALLSRSALSIYLRKLQRGDLVPEQTELVKALGSLARPATDALEGGLRVERPLDVKNRRLGRQTASAKAKSKRMLNKQWAKTARTRLRQRKGKTEILQPPTSRVKFICPSDALTYLGLHDTVCMVCAASGGTLATCSTCPRTCHTDMESCSDLQPIHPASSKIGDVVDKWYCRECCASFEQGTYVCTEDAEALRGRAVLSEGSEKYVGSKIKKDFGVEHGVHSGTVTTYDGASRLYSVTYNDGDCEDLSHEQLLELEPMIDGAPAKPTHKMKARKVRYESAYDEKNRHDHSKMAGNLAIAAEEHYSVPTKSKVTARAPRRSQRQSARVNLLGPTSHRSRRAGQAYRLDQRRRRQEFAKARVCLTGSTPMMMGIPIELDRESPEGHCDAEWTEDMTLEAAYDFMQSGTESRPKIVVNAMTIEDEDNPRPKTVLHPSHRLHREWCAAIGAEMWGLQDKNVFEPMAWDSLSSKEQRMCLTSKLILKAKRSPIDGSITKFKARLTAGGHRSVQDYHYQDSATPGASSSSPRLITTMAALTRQMIYSWDITQAYTQAELLQGKTIHIHVPPEMQRMTSEEGWDASQDNPFQRVRRPRMVLKLTKNLYGLKSGGVDFFTSMNDHIVQDHNMHLSYGDTNLYTTEYCSKTKKCFPSRSHLDTVEDEPNRHPRQPGSGGTRDITLCALWIYVDDGFFCGPRTWRDEFMKKLKKRWEVPDQAPATDVLNIRIKQSLHESNKALNAKTSKQRKDIRELQPVTIELSQSTYIRTKIFGGIGETLPEWTDPSNVAPRRTPMDLKVMDLLDNREPVPKGKVKPDPDEKYRTLPRGLGYVSLLYPDDLTVKESTMSSAPHPEYGCEDLTVDDSSKDATKWSLNKMADTFDYKRLIAQLLWCSRNTRPDITVVTSILCRHSHNTPHLAYRGLIQTLRYLASNIELGLTYTSEGNAKPVFYTDSDFTTGRCRAGSVTMLAGAAIDWSSCLSGTLAISTAEAELYAAIISQKRALILRKDLEHLGILAEDEPLDYRQDNRATFLMLSRRVTDYSRMRHIENGFLKCIEWELRERVKWTWEPTRSMLADFFTKCLPVTDFLRLRAIIMNLPSDSVVYSGEKTTQLPGS